MTALVVHISGMIIKKILILLILLINNDSSNDKLKIYDICAKNKHKIIIVIILMIIYMEYIE